MGGVCGRHIITARKILESLLKTHGASLSDLQTILVEVEAIVTPANTPLIH